MPPRSQPPVCVLGRGARTPRSYPVRTALPGLQVGDGDDEAQALGLELDVGPVGPQQIDKRPRLAIKGIGEDFARLGLD